MSVSADTVNNDNVYWVTDIGTPVKFPQYGLVNFNYTYTGDWNGSGWNGMIVNDNLIGHSVFSALNLFGASPKGVSDKYVFTEANFSCSNVPKKGKLVIVGGFASLSRDNSNRVSVFNHGAILVKLMLIFIPKRVIFTIFILPLLNILTLIVLLLLLTMI